jgi:hypothetical protein
VWQLNGVIATIAISASNLDMTDLMEAMRAPKLAALEVSGISPAKIAATHVVMFNYISKRL